MASSTTLSKNSARAAGVLTISGLMIGGIALAQGANAAPEAEPVSQVAADPVLSGYHQEIGETPALLARPDVAPKTHDQIAAEQAAADQAAADQAAADQAAADQAAADQAAIDQAAADQAAAEQAAADQAAEAPVEETPAPVVDEVAASDELAPQSSVEPVSFEEPASEPAPAEAAPAEPAAAPAPEAPAQEAPAAEPAAQSSGSYDGAAVVAAAKSQIGVQQDCTALVSNALRSVGINFHGWPADYQQLGHTVSAGEAKPGDLIYYASNGMGQSHIAVYIGDGKAIHGGWEGGTTAEFSADLPAASAPVYISVDR